MANTRTLSVLRGLDGDRKGVVLEFLKEANLIEKEANVIDPRNADLSNANLFLANLHDTDLSRAYLSHTNLSEAFLKGADLRDADLSDANLHNVDLSNATITEELLVKTFSPVGSLLAKNAF